MNDPKSSSARNERLQSLLNEQSRVQRSRLRRRNTSIAAAMILLFGGVAWFVTPQRPAAQPNRAPQAKTQTLPQPEPTQVDTAEPVFRIARVEDRPLQLIEIQGDSQPRRVEYINDLQLFMAMRQQGIDAGLLRVNGQTQLAFNDEESKRRFENGFGSAE